MGNMARQGQSSLLEDQLESYEPTLSESQKEILSAISLFRRTPSWPDIEPVLDEGYSGVGERCKSLTRRELRSEAERLRDLGLVLGRDPNHPEELDSHALVRQHFENRLRRKNPASWKSVQALLFDRYASESPDMPSTFVDLEPLYDAVAHGCAAGREEFALGDTYRRRMLHGQRYFSTFVLGKFADDLAILPCFFDEPWEKPAIGLNPEARAFVLNQAGYYLSTQGRPGEARRPLELSLSAYKDIDRNTTPEERKAHFPAGNLVDLFMFLGDFKKALRYAEEHVELTDASHDIDERVQSRTRRAHILSELGERRQATDYFREAATIKIEAYRSNRGSNRPAVPFLWSLGGYYFVRHLLHGGKTSTARLHARKMERAQTNVVYQQAFHLLADAAVLCALARRERQVQSAAAAADLAARRFEQAGVIQHVPDALIEKAKLYERSGRFGRAHPAFLEALAIARLVGAAPLVRGAAEGAVRVRQLDA
jgi:tetratricopeptide (TPR) repeat protein